jgi:hypothetical protein
MKIIFLIITLITFVIFFIEALIHFNIGKNGNDYDYNCVCNYDENKSNKHNYISFNDYSIKLHIPDYNEFIKISLTVLFFSIISGIISTLLIRYHVID